MPFKFACEHCDRVLSVSSSKIGRRAKCPGCGETITVPDKESAAESRAQRKAVAAAAGEENPFAQFEVFDDAELVYESEDFEKKKADIPIDHDKVAVPRRIIYIQGVLLGVVALLFFVFGVLVGSAGKSGAPASTETVGDKCTLTGAIYYETDEGEQPDKGALVIVLPQGTRPDDRVDPLGLRPNTPADPEDVTKAKRAIREIGGYLTNADDQGRFRLEVPNTKTYHVLYVSGNARRQPGTERTQEENIDVVEIEEYIYPVRELIEQNEFRWETAQVGHTNSMQLAKVVFE